MTVMFLLLPLALLLSGVGAWAFLWATRRGQFDDLRTPAVRILHDDGPRRVVSQREGEPTDPGSAPGADREA